MGYNVYRKDRSNQAYGGVLLAISKKLNCCECPGLDTDCELLWVKIDMVGVKTIHFGAFYRPPNSDQLVLDHLSESLERLVDCTNGNIWLGGDFNAPHIDWPLLDLLPLAGSKRPIYQRLIDISHHHNIEQIVDKPTRRRNILDLIFTNNKSTLIKLDTLPPLGKADHDIVYLKIDIRPNRLSTPKRKIFIFQEADWEAIKRKLYTLLNYLRNTTKRDVNTIWFIIKTTLLNAMQEFIPQKQIMSKHCLPWITYKIRELIRAKHRLHAKLKYNSSPNILGKYKQARHTLQIEIRKSYWSYIENIIDYTVDTHNRHTKQKNFGRSLNHPDMAHLVSLHYEARE